MVKQNNAHISSVSSGIAGSRFALKYKLNCYMWKKNHNIILLVCSMYKYIQSVQDEQQNCHYNNCF